MHARRNALRCALALAIGVWTMVGTAAAVEPGEAAPGFSMPALDGGVDLSLREHRGKVVYLDFWASWCGPCLTSLPLLDELRSEFSRDDFEVVAVNLDRDPELGRRLLVKLGIDYRSGADPSGEVPSSYGVSTMPTSFLIDRDGVVRVVHEGFRPGDVDGLRGKIGALVATPAKAAPR